MSVDAFIMPLWRFKVGDFDAPLEGVDGPGIVLSDDPMLDRVPRPRMTGLWPERRARKEVRAIATAVSRANDRAIEWHDDGDVALVKPFHGGDALAAYVWWLDRRDVMPPWDAAYARPGHPLFDVAPDRPSRFKHLGDASLISDYVLPVEFAQPAYVEPYTTPRRVNADRPVLSAPRLLVELDQLNQILRAEPGQEWDDNDPLAAVRYAYLTYRGLLKAAMEHRLPLILWG